MTRLASLVAALLLLAAAGIFPTVATVRAQNEGAIANGATGKRYISVGTTEDENQLKATPGIVLSITATNTNAAARYLKCFNLTAANAAPGTSAVWLGLAIPPAAASGPLHVTFPSGVFFDTALTCALVTGSADSDVAEVASGEVMWFITYK